MPSTITYTQELEVIAVPSIIMFCFILEEAQLRAAAAALE